jgi:hypothetical protein
MVYPTPTQDDLIEHSAIPTIRSDYKNYVTTFVILHPFLIVKPHYNIRFETGNWPTKKEIITSTRDISWAEIIQRAGLHDINELDRLLAYLHCERRTADREGWIKLTRLLDKDNIIPAEVDYLPTSLTNPLMRAIQALGYATVNEFEFKGNLRKEHQIETILSSKEKDFVPNATVRTPDDEIAFATYFDKRFTYLSASRQVVESIVQHAGLEGFYCNENTRQEWSDKLQTDNLIDWSSPERKRN